MNYGNTADEMAVLCSEGQDCWLLSSHISWLLEKATISQAEAICLCLPGPGPEELQQLFLTRQGQIKTLFFVTNNDGTSFFATPQRRGCHWVLIVVEIEGPDILYCDS
ncbi:hypothetical protein PoB_003190600 [Plakobranchus ocellatus]|uniref:Ubiquitin-like protease family profile domain-containing protein n=1 Tax=Plakobranchus ocellatus TaxID=259542 RepID=A0AAV4AFJ2_9GAST|nr:hypothetical protein PoB_003190600 [Plakobranchus ocellatus]